jgi:hypothetical protein
MLDVTTTNQEDIITWERKWQLLPSHKDISNDQDTDWLGERKRQGRILNALGLTKPHGGDTTFPNLEDIPVLILLAETDMGKTQTLKAAYRHTSKRIQQAEQNTLEVTHFLQLGDYSELFLNEDLFKDTKLIKWNESSSQKLHLFLDSVDEGQLSITNFFGILKTRFSQYDTKRLFLRLTCRPLDWSITFQDELEKLWGRENVKLYSLTPLDETDIEIAASHYGVDAQKFKKQIEERQAQFLTFKPRTLKVLLREFRDNNVLPTTQQELYSIGCQQLIREYNPVRRKKFSEQLLQQNYILATRMAAVSCLSNISIFSYGYNPDEAPGFGTSQSTGDDYKTIKLGEVQGGIEKVYDGLTGIEEIIKVDEQSLAQVLGSGLFTPVSNFQKRWIERSIAEFLGAEYLTRSGLELAKILSVLTYPDGSGTIVPQLYQTAVFAAGIRAELFKALLPTNPHILLRVDPQVTTPEQRATLVENLLAAYTDKKIPQPTWADINYYKHLVHPGLAEQLRPYLTISEDATTTQHEATNSVAQYVAIEIAEACGLYQALEDELVAIALSAQVQIGARTRAAYLVSRYGGQATKAKLRPLVFSQAGPDPDKRLKGIGLTATWPENLNANELFQVLTFPGNIEGSSEYHTFFYNFTQHLTEVSLSQALRWMRKQADYLGSQSEWVVILESMLLKAWDFLDKKPELAVPFAGVCLSWLRYEVELINLGGRGDELRANDEKTVGRRQVVLGRTLFILSSPRISDHERESLTYRYAKSGLVTKDDVPWLLELLENEYTTNALKGNKNNQAGKKIQNRCETLARLIYFVTPSSDETLLALISKLEPKCPPLAKMFAAILISYRTNQLTVANPSTNTLLPSETTHDGADEMEPVLVTNKGDDKPTIASTVGEMDTPIANSSEDQQAHKEEEEQEQEQEEEKQRQQQDKLMALRSLMADHENDITEVWLGLNEELSFPPGEKVDRRRWRSHYSDIKILPCWSLLNDDDQFLLRTVAIRYLQTKTVHSDKQDQANQLYITDIADYRAIRFLWETDRSQLEGLDDSVWRSWIGTILIYHYENNFNAVTFQQELIKKVYEKLPIDFLRLLDIVMDLQKEKAYDIGTIPVLSKLEPIWNEQIASVILSRIQSEVQKGMPTPITPKSFWDFRELLGFLLSKKHEASLEYARSLVSGVNTPSLPFQKPESLIFAVKAAAQLLLHAAQTNGSLIMETLNQPDNDIFGYELLKELLRIDSHLEPRLRISLSDENIAGLYIWIVQRLGVERTEQSNLPNGVDYNLVKDGRVYQYANGLLNSLSDRGTVASKNAIWRIVEALPQVDWLIWTFRAAEEKTRRSTWSPYKPPQIMALFRQNDRRLVNSGSEFIEAVIESLRRLEEKFRSSISAARDVWDAKRSSIGRQTQDNKYYPISENDFSDYVTRHLNDDFNARHLIINRRVVINREVEHQASRGIGTGSRLDIKLEAVSVDTLKQTDGSNYNSEELKEIAASTIAESNEVIRLIIEVKAPWNDDLENAMRDQLVGQYLTDDTRYQHGVYLVGWFKCEKWDEKDNRAEKPDYSLEEARAHFDEQAILLSSQPIRMANGTTRKVTVRAFVINAALYDPTTQHNVAAIPLPSAKNETTTTKKPRGRPRKQSA